MHTLFSENILSPPPTPAPINRSNPFELSYPPTSFPPATPIASSAGSSSSQNDLLTENYQNSQQSISGETAFSFGNDASITRHAPTRRKGNPKLIFMGTRRSGKSSIQKVIFEKYSPAETLYLEPTTKIETATMDSFMTFEALELPSTTLTAPLSTHDSLFATAGSLIWVLDMQDEYFASISLLIQTAVHLLQHHPRINFEVFIHKTDGLSEEYKYDTFRDVRQRVTDELADAGYGDRGIAFYQTSIFDHSVYEAMSKVVQKLVPQLPAMEALLNKLCSACRIQKAYLFDTVSKIYLATDASPTFLKDYEACADYVDVVVDVKQIYGWRTGGKGKSGQGEEKEVESGSVGESLITYDGSGNTYVYAREVNEYLSLICVMGQGSTADKRVLIDYNASILHEALVKMFKL
ncbi:unnamed protein product [Zymoseptoria tritici ST99CH_3D1]|nr:unnamed protein product [Zymoseptoria tritici ST99CH_3D1]